MFLKLSHGDSRTAGHFRALAYSDMPALLGDLIADQSISSFCLRFTILTVARTKEAVVCRWADVDLAARTRSVQILKGGRAWQHVIPLSDQALELLRGLLVDGKPADELVFPARNRRGDLGQNSMLRLLERTGWRVVSLLGRPSLKGRAIRWNAPTSAATSSISAAV